MNTETNVLFKSYFKVPRHSSKKNEKIIMRCGPKSWIGKNKDAEEYDKWVYRALTIEKIKHKLDTPIQCDLNAEFIFYFPESKFYTKKGVRSKTIGDLSNIIQSPEDCLQSIGIIENDTLICSYNGSCRLPIKGSDYFLRIELTRI